MKALDSSVILASLNPDEPRHAACDRLLSEGTHVVWLHALAETFAVLTGGSRRLRPAAATQLIEESVLPFVHTQALSAKDVMSALAQCQKRGVRGGAVYDLLHLVAARKAGVESLVTIDGRDFQALLQPGDPRIDVP